MFPFIRIKLRVSCSAWHSVGITTIYLLNSHNATGGCFRLISYTDSWPNDRVLRAARSYALVTNKFGIFITGKSFWFEKRPRKNLECVDNKIVTYKSKHMPNSPFNSTISVSIIWFAYSCYLYVRTYFHSILLNTFIFYISYNLIWHDLSMIDLKFSKRNR